MPDIDLSLLGDKALEKKLNRIATKDKNKVVKAAMRNAAKQTVLPKAIEYAPVDSGKLKTGIVIRALRGGRKSIGVLVQTKPRDHFDISNDDPYYYPAVVEFGSDDQPAQSYLRRAKDSQAGIFISKVGQLIGSGIEKLAKR